MQTNSNLSCIPFYENLEEQDFRKWYAYGDKYINRVPNDYLLPFFFPLPITTASREWEIVSSQLYRLCWKWRTTPLMIWARSAMLSPSRNSPWRACLS